MRILIISNFYPPFELGGWEQLTEEIVEGLSKRGHEIEVLTSKYKSGQPGTGDNHRVFRTLNLESDDFLHYHPFSFITRYSKEKENRKILAKSIDRFHPDLIFIHGMWNLPRSIAWYAEHLMPGKVIYYLASDWPYSPDSHANFWLLPAEHDWSRIAKRLIGAIPLGLLHWEKRNRKLRFEHVLCVSQFIRQELSQKAKVPLSNSRVVYNGINTDEFSPPLNWKPDVWKNGSPSFLYIGGLFKHKGVHTAIEGFSQVLDLPELINSTLTIIGSGNSEYEAYLKELTIIQGVSDRIYFMGRVLRRELPDLLRNYDVLLFPTIVDEPLARAMQEAMACGLVVIGTTTGGSKELIVDGITGLTFKPGNAADLARQIGNIVANPELRCALAQAGRKAVVERFSIERMMNEIDVYLRNIIYLLSGGNIDNTSANVAVNPTLNDDSIEKSKI